MALAKEDLELLSSLCETAAQGIDPANAPDGDEEDTAKDRQVYVDLKSKVDAEIASL